MTMNLERSLERIYIDFKGFYPIINTHLSRYGYLSSKYINNEVITSLYEPIISFLIKHKFNIINITYSSCRLLHNYFSEEEFLEIFDDLSIEFNSYLNEHGITSFNRYVLVRNDACLSHFVRVNEDDFKTLDDRYTKLQTYI